MSDTIVERKDERHTNCGPLLLIPVFFFLGWWYRGMNQDQNNNPQQTQLQDNMQTVNENSTAPIMQDSSQ